MENIEWLGQVHQDLFNDFHNTRSSLFTETASSFDLLSINLLSVRKYAENTSVVCFIPNIRLSVRYLLYVEFEFDEILRYREFQKKYNERNNESPINGVGKQSDSKSEIAAWIVTICKLSNR